MKSTPKYINIYTITTFLFILFSYFMLAIKNGYMLRWYEEMSLFESTRFFFRQCLHFPGGIIRYAGSWLTQLMYYPILGSVVLIILWISTACLTQKAFRLPRVAFPLALIVPMAMLASIVQIDEAWISITSVGYIYSNTLSYLFVMIAACIYRMTERRQILAFIVLLAITGCYFFAGFYALFAALIGVIFMAADSIRDKKYAGLAYSAVTIVAILILPNLYYWYFQPTTVDNDFLLLKGLPDFLMESFDIYLWTPFIVATSALLILTVLSAFKCIPSQQWMVWVSAGLLCAGAVWVVRVDKKNEQLRATVVMLRHLENNDWGAMTRVMSRIKEPPNYTMRVLNNFAIANLGGQPESLKDDQPSTLDARHSAKFSKTAFLDIPLNYYKGDFNVTYRWGMEHSVEYGKRVFYLKYMVKSALLNGDIKVAKRHNDILRATLFHRKWADEMNRYIEDPSLIDTNIEFKSILEVAKKVGS